MATDRRARAHADPEPIATYRLQLGPDRDLDGAADLVPYLADLGISHLYLSPIFEAVPGSTHGYDVTDPNEVRAELGGRPALDRLRDALDAHAMGLLLDIVPNHQAAHHTNPDWWQMLARGPQSDAARTFDVDWGGGPHHPAGTILLPVLGASLDSVLEAGELTLAEGGDGVELAYFEHRFPLRAGTAPAAGTAGDLDALRVTLAQQHYRLAPWRAARTDLAHRRFFDVTTLVGVRVEDPAVFDRTHHLAIELVDAGVVQGLRVDHIDGLVDPDGYLGQLASRTGGAWVVVEKILDRDERLRSDWLVDGTTGYEGGALITSALTDPRGEEPLTLLFQQVSGERRTWPEMVHAAKDEVTRRLFGPELDRLTARFAEALDEPEGAELADAVAALVSSFDRYRLYPPLEGPLGHEDADELARAAERARAKVPSPQATVDRLEALVATGGGGPAGIEARSRLNQVAGAVTAKGVEDTALYRWNALVATGDVGAAPSPMGCSQADLHHRAEQLAAWPHGLVTTSTHDSKRSEDVRARLALLGEVAEEWAAAVGRWSGRVGEDVDGGTRLALWQTLVGAWPITPPRVRAYLAKAIREAKLHTSWTEPDQAYEERVEQLVDAAFADAALCDEIEAFVERLLVPARVNSLAQTLLKVTLPGVADVYQGNEVWRLDLTDPDNRRSVDFDRRRKGLDRAADASAGDVWPETEDGLAKLWLLRRALLVRRECSDAFMGRYEGLAAEGPAADHVVAYVRGGQVLVVVPRFPLALERDGGWRTTTLALPPGSWADALGDGEAQGCSGQVPVADLLGRFPVALRRRARRPVTT